MSDFETDFKGVDDVDEINIEDVRINPDFYIHDTLMKINLVLSTQQGSFNSFYILVKLLESQCLGAKYITVDGIKEVVSDVEKDKELIDVDSRNLALSHKKYNYIVKEVFSNKTIRKPMKTR